MSVTVDYDLGDKQLQGLIGDTSMVDTISSLLTAWKQSFGLGDGNLIASLVGSNSSIFPFIFRSSFGMAGLIDPSFRLNL